MAYQYADIGVLIRHTPTGDHALQSPWGRWGGCSGGGACVRVKVGRSGRAAQEARGRRCSRRRRIVSRSSEVFSQSRKTCSQVSRVTV